VILSGGKGVKFKGTASAGFMNPWEIPAEAVIYSRAKESMRSGSGPRLSIRHGTHAKHKHQVCKSFRGRRGNRLDHLLSSGNQKRTVPQPCCLEKERERHCHPTARAPSYENKPKAVLIRGSPRFESLIAKQRMVKHENPERFNAFLSRVA
jgi:hypothetical protein